MKYFYLEPEVAGGLGDNTDLDHTSKPFKVLHLHYQFEGWLGDILLETFPAYIIAESAKAVLDGFNFSGIAYDKAEVTTSPEFKELYPQRTLPTFVWLQIKGEAARDDFGIAEDCRLVVSERAIEVLRGLGISHAEVEPFDSLSSREGGLSSST